ncbi:MAG: hypothetical protein ABI539_14350 [Acidobacteriota bacterium]
MKKTSIAALVVLLFVPVLAQAQRSEVTINLSEQFFDALLDGVFTNAGPLEFSTAQAGRKLANGKTIFSFAEREKRSVAACSETVKLLREMNGVKTSVRFRDGKILVPLAFSGGYNPPLVGCVDFAGWAESVLDLSFDQANQKLVARVRVSNVALNGTGGVGGSVVARLVQTSIDKRLNPIEIVRLDKLNFLLPLQNTNLKMQAVGIRAEVLTGSLNIHVQYEFVKA